MTKGINSFIDDATKLADVQTNDKYQAGICNIGHEERERRKTYGLMGAILATGWPFICYIFVFPLGFKLLVFFPAFAAVIGLWQYRKQYCAFYGITGKNNFGKLGEAINIENIKQREIDKQKSIRMILISFAITFVYTLLASILL